MKHQIGRGTDEICPRKGYACLIEKHTGREYVVKTSCRTWPCLSCRDRNLSAVRLRIKFGCSQVKRSSLITITYLRGGPSTLMSGPAVEKHQRALFSKWKQWAPNLSWFKVPELTKKRQIHLHYVTGGMPDDVEDTPLVLACEHKARYDDEWRSRACLCVEHRLSALWNDITGSSYVVDARPILSSGHTASYLGKYLVKGLVHRAELYRRGFHRRWSCSRNWPKPALLMRGSVEKRWWKTGFIGGYDEKMEAAAEEDSTASALERVGSPEAVAFGEDMARKGKLNRLKRMVTLD